MKDIKSRIIKSFDETKIGKLIFDGLPWYKRIDSWLFILTFILGMTSVYATRNLNYSVIYTVTFFTILLFGLIVSINKVIKQRLRKKNIKVEKGKFNWSNEEYEKIKLKKFHKELISKRVLTDSKTDIKLIIEYESLFSDESDYLKNSRSYLIGGGVILLFILPVWIQIITQLFKEMNDGEFIETIKLIISFLAMIYMIIYLLYGINTILTEFTNSISKKYKEISRLLRIIRLNLILKNSKTP